MLATGVYRPNLYVLSEHARYTEAVEENHVGARRERFLTRESILEVEVIYAPDLRMASAISARLRGSGWEGPVLLALAVNVGSSTAHGDRIAGFRQDRLACWGTGGALASYLADVARIGIADGAVIAAHGSGTDELSPIITDCCARLRDSIGSAWRIEDGGLQTGVRMAER